MQFVLTLIAAGRSRDLSRVAAAIRAALSITAEPVWLSADKACDLFTDGGDVWSIADAARAVGGGALIDVLVQPAAGRRKRLLVADLESTIIENEMLDEIGDILGIGSRIAEITRRAMNAELDFGEALAARVGLLAGIEIAVLDKAMALIRFTPGARALVATMRRDGATTALATGGFTIFAEFVARELGFHRVVANRLEIADGRLTGRVTPPIVTGETKRQSLVTLAAELGVAPDQTVAVGDGANDLAMLKAAGIGIAFHAKPAVAAVSPLRLDHADLTGLLYAQGYSDADFA